MPVAIDAPTRSASGFGSNPESSRACTAAARMICANRSIRRAVFRSIQFVGSKSFSSQAKCTL